jgi:hypothetical protein
VEELPLVGREGAVVVLDDVVLVHVQRRDLGAAGPGALVGTRTRRLLLFSVVQRLRGLQGHGQVASVLRVVDVHQLGGQQDALVDRVGGALEDGQVPRRGLQRAVDLAIAPGKWVSVCAMHVLISSLGHDEIHVRVAEHSISVAIDFVSRTDLDVRTSTAVSIKNHLDVLALHFRELVRNTGEVFTRLDVIKLSLKLMKTEHVHKLDEYFTCIMSPKSTGSPAFFFK